MRHTSIYVVASMLAVGCAASQGTDLDHDTPGSGGSAAAAGSGASGWGSGGSASTGGSGNSGGGAPEIDSGVGSGGSSSAGAAGSAGASTGGSGGASSGNETLCNGLDDDGNGIIDDVDKGKDGICDCLKIATLGVKGKYGSGDIFANWLAARSDFGAVPLGVQVLTPALLADYELIVAQDVSAKGFFGGGYQAAEVAALQAWVESGGGLMTLIGYEDEYSVNNVNKLLQPFGLSYGSQKILSKGSSSSTVSVTSWMPHAVTQGVSSIGVDNGYEPKGTGSVLATQSGYSMLRVHTAGTGKIALWGDEWITYDSEWTLHPEYQVELFWLNLIKWLSPDNRCQVPIPPGIK